MKNVIPLLICLVSFSCSADDNEAATSAIQEDIQNQVDDAVKGVGKDIEIVPESQGRIYFTFAPISNTSDMTIVHFKNFVTCEMPTIENPIVLLEAYETDDLKSSHIKIDGTSSAAKIDITLSDGRTFTHPNKRIVTGTENQPSYLLTPTLDGETYAISGSYLCPK